MQADIRKKRCGDARVGLVVGFGPCTPAQPASPAAVGRPAESTYLEFWWLHAHARTQQSPYQAPLQAL